MNFFLEIPKEGYAEKIISEYGVGETLAFGGKILLIGILAVFGVLCLIWLALSLFNVIFSKNPSQNKTAPVPTVAPQAPVKVKSNTDDEIVAVIAAAIAMAESENSGTKFRVVSFKRK